MRNTEGSLERNGTMELDMIDKAEDILRTHGCRIQSFLASGGTQYFVKNNKTRLSDSPSFKSIRELCQWVVDNEKEFV
jgi:hypothetical protein